PPRPLHLRGGAGGYADLHAGRGEQDRGAVHEMRDATEIIIRPLLTEKSILLQRLNKFTFEVARDATKIEIQRAIEVLGDCKNDRESGVLKINTLVVKGK